MTRPLILCTLIICTTLFNRICAQTLFTYGKHAVSRAEFLKAYNKNNSDSSNGKMSYADYLDLYANFRIKVQAALDQKIDTTAAQRSELQAFRSQLSESFLKEDASIRSLVDEAAQRSLKDIHLLDIFVAAPSGSTAEDISAAEAKIRQAYAQLKNGESFAATGARYTFLDLGYITAFTLPYDLENIAYATPLGKFSEPYQTRSGFHILQPVDERKAIGKVRVAQILLAFPPDADATVKQQIATRADSAYNALIAGADFASLATQLSNDNLSYPAGGRMPAFGVGEYDPAFEKAAFDLEKNGDISRPVLTSFGYHIISRIERIPVTADTLDKAWISSIRERVLQSDRMKVAQAHLVQNVRRLIDKDAPPEVKSSDSAVLEYYRSNLEKYNAEFAEQLKEFAEGNLLFTIMQKNVWDAAATDTSALLAYFNSHKDKYWWENSADALLVTSQNKNEIADSHRSMKQLLPVWRKWSAQSNGLIQVDSGRFELSQIPVLERTNFTEGLATAPVTNPQDSSTSFAYIIRLYQGKEPKKFEDAKGAIISDYQTWLEDKWLADLKKKYPVRVNKKVFNSLGRIR